MQSLAPDSGSSFREGEIGERRQPGGGKQLASLLLLPVLGLLLLLPAPPRPRLGSARLAPPPSGRGKKARGAGQARGAERRRRPERERRAQAAAGAALAAAPAERAWSRRAGSTGGRAASWPGPGPRAPHRPQPGHPDLPGARGAPAGGGRGGGLRAPAGALPGASLLGLERAGGGGGRRTPPSARTPGSAAGDAGRSWVFATRRIKSSPAGPLLPGR